MRRKIGSPISMIRRGCCLVLLLILPVQAKMDLVTLPKRDGVQVTIYNSADLTLVRETRELTLQKGINRLQFSWANTLIDPTSLEMLPKAQADKLAIEDLTYPPRTQNLGIWTIKSQVSGKVPVEITYLTSGLDWRAFYMGTLSGDEKTMKLEGYVRVGNRSGEDYEDAQVRLIVGQVHLLDQIAELAQRQYPYGAPAGFGLQPVKDGDRQRKSESTGEVEATGAVAGNYMMLMDAAAPKEIIKEGLSEYFLYTIEGKETIPNEWAKRLPSLGPFEVPVVNLYKFEEEKYGAGVVRFLSFTNDEAHKLGQTPIPDGMLRVFRTADEAGHLSYEGQSEFKYIPVNEKVELNLGGVENVAVTPTLMDFKTENFTFDSDRNVSGWDEVKTFKIEVKNTRPLAVKVEIQRNFPGLKWDLNPEGDCGLYEKVDLDTVKFTLELPPRSQKEFKYTVREYQGKRAE
jgi:hypothetical protein